MFRLLPVGSEDPHVVRFELKNPGAEQFKNGDFSEATTGRAWRGIVKRTDKLLVLGHFLLARVCRVPVP